MSPLPAHGWPTRSPRLRAGTSRRWRHNGPCGPLAARRAALRPLAGAPPEAHNNPPPLGGGPVGEAGGATPPAGNTNSPKGDQIGSKSRPAAGGPRRPKAGGGIPPAGNYK